MPKVAIVCVMSRDPRMMDVFALVLAVMYFRQSRVSVTLGFFDYWPNCLNHTKRGFVSSCFLASLGLK